MLSKNVLHAPAEAHCHASVMFISENSRPLQNMEAEKNTGFAEIVHIILPVNY